MKSQSYHVKDIPIVFDMNAEVYDMKDMMLKTMNIHHQVYRSKIAYGDAYNKKRMTMQLSPKSFAKNCTQYQLSDNHFTLKCPLTENEEKNLLLFEKRIIKMMGKKLINGSCLKDLQEALNYFHSNLIYDEEKPFFVCKLSRENPDVEELVQSFCLYANQENKDTFVVSVMPQDACFKPNKSLFVDYEYFVEKKEGGIDNEENDNGENDNEEQEHIENGDLENGDLENGMEDYKKDDDKEYENEPILDKTQTHESQKEKEEEQRDDVKDLNDYERLKQDHKNLMKEANQRLLKLKDQQDDIKSALYKFVVNMTTLTFYEEENAANRNESVKNRERREMIMKRYFEKREALKKLLLL